MTPDSIRELFALSEAEGNLLSGNELFEPLPETSVVPEPKRRKVEAAAPPTGTAGGAMASNSSPADTSSPADWVHLEAAKSAFEDNKPAIAYQCLENFWNSEMGSRFPGKARQMIGERLEKRGEGAAKLVSALQGQFGGAGNSAGSKGGSSSSGGKFVVSGAAGASSAPGSAGGSGPSSPLGSPQFGAAPVGGSLAKGTTLGGVPLPNELGGTTVFGTSAGSGGGQAKTAAGSQSAGVQQGHAPAKGAGGPGGQPGGPGGQHQQTNNLKRGREEAFPGGEEQLTAMKPPALPPPRKMSDGGTAQTDKDKTGGKGGGKGEKLLKGARYDPDTGDVVYNIDRPMCAIHKQKPMKLRTNRGGRIVPVRTDKKND